MDGDTSRPSIILHEGLATEARPGAPFAVRALDRYAAADEDTALTLRPQKRPRPVPTPSKPPPLLAVIAGFTALATAAALGVVFVFGN